ncbi:hypothetical protein [Nonomuraea wenchangensis]|uniref:hypothetical protein n=1 Tax=Nonomuraea wenchangensis TaxID=568860 RepID=UPI003316A732
MYPGDPWERIRQLERDVEELKALLSARQPLTAASQGWRMADMGIPSVSAGQVQIGSNGGDFYVATASGVKRIPDLSLPGVTPDYPTSFTSPATIGSAPTAANYNALRADAAMLQVCVRSIINRGASIKFWPAPPP